MWTTISGSGPATTTTRVTNLANGTAHIFQVRAHNSEGSGAASAEVSATPRVLSAPAAPSGLTAAPGPGKATLTWNAGTDDGGVAIDRWEYRQRAGAANYGSWLQVSTDPATVQHEVGSLTPGTRYTFQVRAHNARGDGQSAEASATPTVVPPAQPTGLTATAGAGQVTLMWASGTNSGSAPIDRWQYRQKAGSGAYGSWMQLSTDPAAVQHVVTSLLAGTLHTFQVRAGNTGGAAFGPESAEASATPTLGPPAQPTGLTATPDNRQVTLRWEAGTAHGGAPINLWQYRQKEGAGAYGSWTQISTTPTTTEHELTGLTNDTLYTFQVRAGNTGGGNGPESAEASATPREQGPPGQPTGLTATPDNRQVTLRWDAGTDNRGVVIDRWDFRQSTDGTLDTETWTAIPNSGPTTIQHVVSRLTNGTRYTFQVRAHNAEGDGEVSAEASATPRVLTPPSRPSGLTATGGPGQVTLMWNAGHGRRRRGDRPLGVPAAGGERRLRRLDPDIQRPRHRPARADLPGPAHALQLPGARPQRQGRRAERHGVGDDHGRASGATHGTERNRGRRPGHADVGRRDRQRRRSHQPLGVPAAGGERRLRELDAAVHRPPAPPGAW